MITRKPSVQRDFTAETDYPPAPKFSQDPNNPMQKAFEEWYYDLKTVLIRQFRAVSGETGTNQNNNTETN